MRRPTLWVCALLVLAGCFGLPDDKTPKAEVRAFSVSPTTLAPGDNFELTWDIVHSRYAGNVMFFSLFVPSSTGKAQEVFERGDGLSHGHSKGTQKCTYQTNGSIRCEFFGSAVPATPGPVTLTLEACESYVLGDDEVCDHKTFDVVLQGS